MFFVLVFRERVFVPVAHGLYAGQAHSDRVDHRICAAVPVYRFTPKESTGCTRARVHPIDPHLNSTGRTSGGVNVQVDAAHGADAARGCAPGRPPVSYLIPTHLSAHTTVLPGPHKHP